MDKDQDLQELLREELRPRPAPPGFTDSVLARVPGARRRQIHLAARAPWLPPLRWAVAAAVLAAVAGGSYLRHEQQEHLAGERARNQLMLALHITGATLDDVKHKVSRSSPGEPE